MRLLTMKQIQAEKIARGRTWVFNRIAEGKFPKPLPNTVPGLWEEAAVDAAVAAYIEECKQSGVPSGARTKKAAAAREKSRAERAAA